MIKQEDIQSIIETARIEEVVGDYVNLKKRGINLLGLCPFHNEKTPSFTVSPVKGIYKCFGCGKAGNSVNFIMEHEHFSYPEALRYLANKYNIELDEELPSPEHIAALDEKESLFNITAFAHKHFVDNLFNTDDGKAIGLSYFKEREFTEATIKKFELGYTLDKWDEFTQYANKNGYTIQQLEKAGLSTQKDGKSYDRFRARVMFPIHSLSGKVIAFGGRILDADKSKPKYVNSPETDIYNKSKVLYGLNFAKNAISAKDNCFLVEGYTDVITLHQAGIENVVASSGTSLTTEQIKLIYRYTKNITILYDGDPAGIKASFRGVDMILEEEMNVKIVLFPDGEDPDSFIRKNNKEFVIDFIENKAVDFIIYKTNVLKANFIDNTNIVEKTDTINEIVLTLSKISDVIKRDVYITECSKLFKIKSSVISEKIDDLIIKGKNKKSAYFKKFSEMSYGSNTEKDIIRLLLNYGNTYIDIEALDDNKEPVIANIPLSMFIVFDIRNDDLLFEDKLLQKIFDEYEELIKTNKTIPEDYFTNHPDKLISDFASSIIDIPIHISLSWDEDTLNIKKITTKSLLLFKFKIIEKKIEVNTIEVSNSTNDDIIIELLKKRELLITAKKEIYKQLKIH